MTATLKTPITIANGASSVRNVAVVGWRDFAEESPPFGQIVCQAYTNNGEPYPQAGAPYVLDVRDSGQCDRLVVNEAPENVLDRLTTGTALAPGTPYTTAAATYDGTTGGRSAKLLALEAKMVEWGLWAPELSST